jgi:nucleoid DNA-binding protein
MKLEHIAKSVSKRLGIEEDDVKIVLKTAFDEISKGVGCGENVFLRGLGTFKVREMKQKIMNDINLKRLVVKPAYKKIRFIPGQLMKDTLIETNKNN